MSYWTTHIIATNYDGKIYNVNYWGDGDGMDADGYVTDFAQYQSEFTGKLTKKKKKNIAFAFAFFDADGNPKSITNSKDLKDAVENLDHDGVLSVQAIDKSGKEKDQDQSNRGKKGKNRGKGKGKQKQTNKEESDDESSEDGAWGEKETENGKKEKKVDKSDKTVHATLERFVKQIGSCHHCNKTEWTGRKYTYAYFWTYSMCGACYDKLDKSYQEDWESTSLPWDGDVPAAPLGEDYDVRGEVKHLQYLLTRLGYLKLADTALLTGSYRENTENAVEQFRKKFNITGGDMTMYNKKTETKLAQIVKKLRNEGHKYLA